MLPPFGVNAEWPDVSEVRPAMVLLFISPYDMSNAFSGIVQRSGLAGSFRITAAVKVMLNIESRAAGWKPLRPVGPVERAILDGLAEMARFKVLGSVQIGDGTRDFQDAIMSARGKAQAANRVFQQFFALLTDGAKFPY